MGSKEQFVRLCGRLGELGEKIDGFLIEQRLEREKKVSPRIRNKGWNGKMDSGDYI